MAKPRYRLMPAKHLRRGWRFIIPGTWTEYRAGGFHIISDEKVIVMVGSCRTLHIHGQMRVWVEVSRG